MRVKKSRKKYGGSRGGDIAIFILLVLLGLFMLFPIYLSAIQSIKPSEELFLFPPKLYAMAPTNQNYVDLINTASNMWVPFSRYIFNSVFVAIVVTISQLIFSSSAAYALAKVQFPGRKFLNKIIEITLLFTSTVLYIMQYIVMATIGIIDTYFAITLPYIATSMGLFLMRQFIGQLPDALIGVLPTAFCIADLSVRALADQLFKIINHHQQPRPAAQVNHLTKRPKQVPGRIL